MSKGSLHPLTILQNEAYEVFSKLGFEIADGPELETLWYNFDALNVPKDHPARDMQDTFYVKGTSSEEEDFSGPRVGSPDHKKSSSSDFVLRTHATNVSARTLERAGKENIKEIATISIGKVFRNEATDITH
ncbi:MAG: hypothetical protein AAB895_01545, partial [Patescibacteria group bacterium]